MIIDFTKKLCTEIGQPNIPIYAGPGMHKIDMSNYPLNLSNMEIIGNKYKNMYVLDQVHKHVVMRKSFL